MGCSALTQNTQRMGVPREAERRNEKMPQVSSGFMFELTSLPEEKRLAYALWLNGKLERTDTEKIVGAHTLSALEAQALMFTVK